MRWSPAAHKLFVARPPTRPRRPTRPPCKVILASSSATAPPLPLASPVPSLVTHATAASGLKRPIASQDAIPPAAQYHKDRSEGRHSPARLFAAGQRLVSSSLPFGPSPAAERATNDTFISAANRRLRRQQRQPLSIRAAVALRHDEKTSIRRRVRRIVDTKSRPEVLPEMHTHIHPHTYTSDMASERVTGHNPSPDNPITLHGGISLQIATAFVCEE